MFRALIMCLHINKKVKKMKYLQKFVFHTSVFKNSLLWFTTFYFNAKRKYNIHFMVKFFHEIIFVSSILNMIIYRKYNFYNCCCSYCYKLEK